MRTRWGVGAAGLAIFLAGCEGAPEVDQTVAGLNAFRAGDRPALEKARAELAKIKPPATDFPNPCSPDDYSQRRAKAFNGLLSRLDAPWPDSETEDNRFLRFETVIQSGEPGAESPNVSTCLQSAERNILVMADTAERFAVVKAEHDILVSWGPSLGHYPAAEPQ